MNNKSDPRRPVDRPKRFQELERRRRRQEKGQRWYRREVRGTKMREGIFIIPPTPKSLLAKTMKKICQDDWGTGIYISGFSSVLSARNL